MRGLSLGAVAEVHLLAAHCDDVAIGAGGTLLTLCRANPGLRVRALVLTGAGTQREAEERGALAALCPGADLEVTVLQLPDGRVPSQWLSAKQAVHQLAATGQPDLVLAPHVGDAHQDHRALAQLAWQAYRDTLVWGYEIVKWEGDLPTPTLHVPLDDDVLAAKLGVLTQHYPSQHGKPWFDDDLFRGLARVRGVHAGTRWAEAFVTPKIICTLQES